MRQFVRAFRDTHVAWTLWDSPHGVARTDCGVDCPWLSLVSSLEPPTDGNCIGIAEISPNFAEYIRRESTEDFDSEFSSLRDLRTPPRQH